MTKTAGTQQAPCGTALQATAVATLAVLRVKRMFES